MKRSWVRWVNCLPWIRPRAAPFTSPWSESTIPRSPCHGQANRRKARTVSQSSTCVWSECTIVLAKSALSSHRKTSTNSSRPTPIYSEAICMAWRRKRKRKAIKNPKLLSEINRKSPVIDVFLSHSRHCRMSFRILFNVNILIYIL